MNITTKRGELSGLAQETMIAFMAPLSLVDASEQATCETVTELTSHSRGTARNAHESLEARAVPRPKGQLQDQMR